MIISFIHKDTGKVYTVPVNQVVMFNDGGDPVAVSYEQAGFLISTNKSMTDFDRVLALLGIQKLDIKLPEV